MESTGSDIPLVGVGLPIVGPYAGPHAVTAVAQAADRLGFHSVSTSERLLVPAAPGWTNDFGLPEDSFYDAIESLTWVAAVTERVRLLTGVVNSLFQPPIVLARRFATLDQLSGGRVDVGIANGWLPEEFAAVGVPMSRRGAGFEDHLAAMRACWGPDPVEHAGPRYTIPRALVGPKPFADHLPVLIGALAPIAIERAARLGDGLILGLRDWDSAQDQISAYREAGGRGRIVLRAGPMLADAQHAEPPTTFTPACVVDDLQHAAALGVDEVIWDLNIVGMHPDEQIHEMERLASRLQS